MGVAPLPIDFIIAPQTMEKPQAAPPENKTADCNAADELDQFRAGLERLVCERVNSHFWMSAPSIKQRDATPALLHTPARHGALARARHWVWLFLYRHPFSGGISTPAIGRFYDRDHTTVLYGIRKIDHSLKHRPDGVEAKALRAIACALAPVYGAFITGGP